MDVNTSGPATAAKSFTDLEEPGHENAAISSCCQHTLRIHSANNPMMVCSECKQIIKVFRDMAPYRNYLKFCQSRHRKVLSTKFEGLWVVIFKAYETT